MILFLSDVAGSEVMLILLFVLMFFGSKSIPGLAKTMGKTMRQIKDASQDLQNEIKKSGIDIKKDLNLDRMIEETVDDIERPFHEQERELNAAIRFEAPRSFEAPQAPVEIAEVLPESETDAAEIKAESADVVESEPEKSAISLDKK